jgi:hypothetical protein
MHIFYANLMERKKVQAMHKLVITKNFRGKRFFLIFNLDPALFRCLINEKIQQAKKKYF